jgi:hypothetical protein
MLKVENYFLMLVILLNLVNLLSFTLSYADTDKFKFRPDLSLGSDVLFVLYYSFLLLFSASLLYSGRITAGFIVFLLTIAPFFVEQSSTNKGKDESFFYSRIKILLLNLFIICLI